jgi:hypothetical protein
MPRVRSPCTSKERKLPAYKTKQRGIPRDSKETLQRYRYEVREDGVPCRRVADNVEGKTRCHAPTEHSRRRKTCALLVDANTQFPPNFTPGLYLFGGRRLTIHSSPFVCKSVDWETFTNDTKTPSEYLERDPFGGDVAVLGPYVDPVTERVTVRCVDIETLDPQSIEVNGLPSQVNLGRMFAVMDGETMEMGIPVPTATMLKEFVKDLDLYAGKCQEAALRCMGGDVPSQSLRAWLTSIGMEEWEDAMKGAGLEHPGAYSLFTDRDIDSMIPNTLQAHMPMNDINIILQAMKLDRERIWKAKYSKLKKLSNALDRIQRILERDETKLKTLQTACQADESFQKRARIVARLFFEIALYSRRWAGPDRPFPISKLPAAVGTATNPLSERLSGKYAVPTQRGVVLKTLPVDEQDNFRSADVVDEYGMLQRMQQACGASILMIWDTLTPRQRKTLRNAMGLGYEMYQIDGSGYWQSYDEVNTVNGNPNEDGLPFQLDLWGVYFGTPTADELNDPRALYAESSVQGTGTYCVQIAAGVCGRTILSMLPSLYKSRPVWAAHEGVWTNLHT